MELFGRQTGRRRAHTTAFVITFVVSLLATVFFSVQVMGGEAYAAAARSNRLRPIPIPAPRGTVLDRHGRVVATSLTTYSVHLAPGEAAAVRRTLAELAPFLGLTAGDLHRLMETRARRPHALLEVAPRATYAQAAAVAERRGAFPGVLLVEQPVRHYPAGAAAAHVVGYTGQVTARELESARYVEAGYRQGRLVGKTGIERQYELALSGRDGARFAEVDARGRVVRAEGAAPDRAPVAGETLRLTLDLELQRYVHRIFPDSMKGALVAMVPTTGEVLAIYSNPTFDPNDLARGPSHALWSALNRDPRKPLLDRAITARYPPASTWKLATAAAAARRGLVREDTRMPLACRGGMAYAGRYARCHDRSGHGAVPLSVAIEKSCNVYFYQLGIRLGLENLARAGTRMGFARRTGIDLPGEAEPTFPTGRAWYREHFGSPAVPSDVLSLAIGQGPNSQTVLGMAHFYSALAGDGTAARPRLAAAGSSAGDEREIDLGLDRAGVEALWSGLRRVAEPGGTARTAALARWRIYGKTGTAQNSQGADHGWFAGFAGLPGGHPEIVVAVLVEHGLHGGDVAPIAAKAMEFYLSRTRGIAPDPRPTLAERWETGRMRWNTYDPPAAPLVPRPRR